jgi:hypothetical protein
MQRQGDQLDIEDAIAGTPPRMTFKERREFERQRIAKVGAALEKLIADAKPGSPLHRELSVRTGRRLVDSVFRRAKKLTQVTEPEPWMSAPTRERVDQAGEEPLKRVVWATEGEAQGLIHRWGSPVQRAHARQVLAPEEYLAAARFRRAFLDSSRDAPTTGYGEESDKPNWRNPLTRREAEASWEFQWVWERLEPRMRSEAWILILEKPLAGQTQPLSVVEFGKQVGKTECEKHARGFTYGSLFTLLIRLAGLYRLFDVAADEAAYAHAKELCKGPLGRKAEREGWLAELIEYCRQEGRLPQEREDITALVAAAREQLLTRRPQIT